MSEGKFTVKNKVKLSEMNLNDEIPESDYSTLTPDGFFVQLQYHEAEERELPEMEVKPGVWIISSNQMGMYLHPTSFVKDKILEEFIHTKHISDKINLFFNKLNVYYELGFEVPKRAALLFGPAGTGKTSSISKVVRDYAADGETAIVIWPTDKYEAFKVKDFVKSFKYVGGVKKLIMIVEDIGGVEIDQVRMKSDSSLLSLLDNQEKTFKIPVFILATTNHPEVFLGNLTNRPNRFDDKIEVGYPDPEFRAALLKFFSRVEVSEQDYALIKSDKAKKFSPAHIREIVIRSMIYDKTVSSVMEEMFKEIEHYENGFEKPKKPMGHGAFD